MRKLVVLLVFMVPTLARAQGTLDVLRANNEGSAYAAESFARVYRHLLTAGTPYYGYTGLLLDLHQFETLT